jgi:alpha/beta superfamily hydrolase
MKTSADRVFIPSGDVQLEAQIGVIHNEDVTGTKYGIICTHPYSKMGGNLDNNVPSALFKHFVKKNDELPQQLQNSIHVVVRFNFRGVGQSTGSSTITAWDEREDGRAVCEYILKKYAIQKIIFLGYSCGSLITSGIADEIEQVDSFIAISYPKGWWAGWLFSSHYAKLTSKKPKLFILGTQDQFASISSFKSYYNQSIPDPKELYIVEDADHFWFGMEQVLVNRIQEFLMNQIK